MPRLFTTEEVARVEEIKKIAGDMKTLYGALSRNQDAAGETGMIIFTEKLERFVETDVPYLLQLLDSDVPA